MNKISISLKQNGQKIQQSQKKQKRGKYKILFRQTKVLAGNHRRKEKVAKEKLSRNRNRIENSLVSSVMCSFFCLKGNLNKCNYNNNSNKN